MLLCGFDQNSFEHIKKKNLDIANVFLVQETSNHAEVDSI